MDEQQPTNGDAYRDRLRQAVEEDFDSLVRHLVTGVVEELPEYESSANDTDDVQAAIKHTARLVLSAVFGSELHEPDASVWEVIGAQRARGGLPREALAAAPTVAMHRGFEFVLGKSVTIPAPGSVATAVLKDVWTRLAKETATISTSLLTGYDERRHLDLSESTRPQVALVDRLLSGMWDDPSEIIERGKRLGVDVACPHGVLVLVSLGDSAADLDIAGDELLRLVPEALGGPCRTTPRLHRAVLVPARPTEPWRKAVNRAGTVAKQRRLTIVSIEPVDPVDALAGTYRHMLPRLTAVSAAGSGPGMLTTFDLEYHWMLNQAPVAERVNVVRTVLGPLLDTAKSGELLDLLDALYETRSGVAEVARMLGIHANTVGNRKRLVHDLTGLSLDVPADAHRLFTARLLHKALIASGTALVGPQGSA